MLQSIHKTDKTCKFTTDAHVPAFLPFSIDISALTTAVAMAALMALAVLIILITKENAVLNEYLRKSPI